MYFAHMYCYGKDSRCVGVTGIRQCMGIFFAYDKMLYSLHAPDSGRYNALVPGIFANYLKEQIGKIQPKNARLYFVLNKDNRQRVEGEMEATCRAIGLKTYTLMRIRKNIGLYDGMDESIVVACQYLPNVKGVDGFAVVHNLPLSEEIEFRYKLDNQVKFLNHFGGANDGKYNGAFEEGGLSTGITGPGWHIVNKTNSDISVVAI